MGSFVISKTVSLRITISTGDPRPIFRQIVDGISLALMKGELSTGDKLPSVRALGMQLTVNPNTVAKAYAELVSRGLLDSKQGLGLFVSNPKRLLSKAERNRRLQQAIQTCIGDVMHLHLSDEEILAAMRAALEDIRSIKAVSGTE